MSPWFIKLENLFNTNQDYHREQFLLPFGVNLSIIIWNTTISNVPPDLRLEINKSVRIFGRTAFILHQWLAIFHERIIMIKNFPGNILVHEKKNAHLNS